MLNKIRLSWQSFSNNTQFIITNLIYVILLVGSTIYCYARLDYVRSYKTPAAEVPIPKKLLQPTEIP